jgi:hypothetical protein
MVSSAIFSKIFCHRNYIGNIERGENGIGIDNIVLLARRLNVKSAVLFDKW